MNISVEAAMSPTRPQHPRIAASGLVAALATRGYSGSSTSFASESGTTVTVPAAAPHTRRTAPAPWPRPPTHTAPYSVCLLQDVPEAASVGRLRRRISRALEDFGGAHLAGTIAQVASELLTNALQHGTLGNSPLTATLTRSGSMLVLAVHDNNTRTPTPKCPGTDEAGGRGMALVEQLADAWGYRFSADGKTVTAEFALIPHPTPCGTHEVGSP